MCRNFDAGISLLVGFAAIFGLAACEKKSGEGVVIGKEHVDAMKAVEARGGEQATPNDQADEQGEQTAAANPRATHNEQWIVDVEMIDAGRKIAVRVDQPQFEKIQIGDRVSVVYRQGKYTGTVWDAEIK